MNLISTLQGIGFDKNEAKIYLATLKLEEAKASDIAKKAKIKRSSAYVILKGLMKKGCISSYTRRRVTHFVATNPKIIIEAAKDRANKAHAILPDLQLFTKSESKEKPRIQYYEGIDGLINIMEDTIVTGNKTVYAWANIDLAWKTLGDYYPEYIRKKNERKVFVRGIFVQNAMAETFQKNGHEEKRNVRMIPEKLFPMSNEINIYDNKFSIISHRDMMGVIVENAEMAHTQRSIWKLGWEAAGNYDAFDEVST